MAKRSAGLLMFRRSGTTIQVLLIHPGGPFWASKDEGAWSIPKGEYGDLEDPLAAARREFQEETRFVAGGEFIPLGEIRQASGKIVTGWAFEGDCDPADLVSNFCTIEWPPRSGRKMEIPEVDRAEWLSIDQAHKKINPAQRPLLDRLAAHVAKRPQA